MTAREALIELVRSDDSRNWFVTSEANHFTPLLAGWPGNITENVRISCSPGFGENCTTMIGIDLQSTLAVVLTRLKTINAETHPQTTPSA